MFQAIAFCFRNLLTPRYEVQAMGFASGRFKRFRSLAQARKQFRRWDELPDATITLTDCFTQEVLAARDNVTERPVAHLNADGRTSWTLHGQPFSGNQEAKRFLFMKRIDEAMGG